MVQNATRSQLLCRDYASVWHPYGRDSDHEALLPITHGAGALLFTEDGRAIIDAISSWWVNLHGHAHPALTEAITRQSTLLSQAIFGSCTHEPAVTLAERLLAIIPADHQCIFYSDDGSTAVEVALKLAMQYWHNSHTPRTRFLALEGAYHGDTFGAMSVSERGVFTNSFGELLFSVDLLPFPGDTSSENSCLAAARHEFSDEVSPGKGRRSTENRSSPKELVNTPRSLTDIAPKVSPWYAPSSARNLVRGVWLLCQYCIASLSATSTAVEPSSE